VHAISDEAKAFYERRGFRPSAIEPMTLMITIEEAQKCSGGKEGVEIGGRLAAATLPKIVMPMIYLSI
jgi:hypothetical protein